MSNKNDSQVIVLNYSGKLSERTFADLPRNEVCFDNII